MGYVLHVQSSEGSAEPAIQDGTHMLLASAAGGWLEAPVGLWLEYLHLASVHGWGFLMAWRLES